ncbi:MAG: ubiquinol oxidase subunit II [Pseudomonadota bacterium]
MKPLRIFGIVALFLLLSGCQMVVMDPSGDIAVQQKDLIIYATILMLLVCLPVMVLTCFFAWKYRESNKDATYEPNWDHSISLEIIIWGVPMAIIICIGGLTWVATHRLNPYDDLRRISATQEIDPNVQPMQIQVVAMDWKWLFIYPEEGIATVNEFATVVDRPVEFKLTSSTVMNAFYVPAMAGMIYAMEGMETELNAVFNEPGEFMGVSANYNGEGFSQMTYTALAFDEEGFDAWVQQAKDEGEFLDRSTYVELDKPSISHPVTRYAGIGDGLWDLIINMCTDPASLCRNDMAMVDALGGGGLAGLYNRELFRGICAVDDARAMLAVLRPDLDARSQEILDAINSRPVQEELGINTASLSLQLEAQ